MDATCTKVKCRDQKGRRGKDRRLVYLLLWFVDNKNNQATQMHGYF